MGNTWYRVHVLVINHYLRNVLMRKNVKVVFEISPYHYGKSNAVLLPALTFKTYLVDLDDDMVMGPNFEEEHLKNLQGMFNWFVSLKLNPRNLCTFLEESCVSSTYCFSRRNSVHW